MTFIREEFTRTLEEADWLDDSTRKLAKRKVRKYVPTVLVAKYPIEIRENKLFSLNTLSYGILSDFLNETSIFGSFFFR